MSRVRRNRRRLAAVFSGRLPSRVSDRRDVGARNALDLASPAFEAVLNRLPKTGPMIVMGLIEAEEGRLFNTAIVVDHSTVIGRYRKAHLLGGEQIFDAGSESHVFEIGGLRFGINICYDTNFPEAARKIADLGASLIVCPVNNMLRRKTAEALKDSHNSVRGERCRETGLWLVSADVTGERDGSISWGPTSVLNPVGKVVAQLPLEKNWIVGLRYPLRHIGRQIRQGLLCRLQSSSWASVRSTDRIRRENRSPRHRMRRGPRYCSNGRRP